MSQIMDDEQLQNRLCDLICACQEKYVVGFTKFLDCADLSFAENYVKSSSCCIGFSFGGFPNAQRRVVGVFPEDIYSNCREDELVEMFELSGIHIKGSGYRVFSHRDILGSLLSLGLKRETIGDISVSKDGYSAFVCVFSSVSSYICSNLEQVANDKVKVIETQAFLLPEIIREYKEISGTVSSFRIDCILSMCLGLSREKVKRLVEGKCVSLNHKELFRIDDIVRENDLISVRGHGRFEVSMLGDVTKKGRYRVVVKKMI